MPTDFTGHVIFCEDVRVEINKQISYIGVFPFNREYFEPDEDGDCILPKFGVGVYLSIPTEYAGHSPHIAFLTIDKGGEEKLVTEETMGKIPSSDENKLLHGVTHIQLAGLFVPVGTKFGVDATIADKTVRIGLFQTLESKKKDEKADKLD